MLRSYGRLPRSLSFQPCSTAVKIAIRAYSAADGSIENDGAAPVPESARRKRMMRSLGVIEATGLAEIQAELEESNYKGTRKPRKSTSDRSGGEASRTRTRSAGKTVEEDDGTKALKSKKSSTKKAAKTTTKSSKEHTPPTKRSRRRRKSELAASIPARLLPPGVQKHHDLASFLNHTKLTNGSTTSAVYKGTHFEYTVAGALKSYNFGLHRTGRSNDLGIDLVGRWELPTHTPGADGMPVIMQCKFAKPTPAMVRELEGAYTGAPAGWRGAGVLAILASTHASTEGVRAACQRSRWPLGVMQVTREGEVKQFVWNAVAADAGLEGLGVAVRYATGGPLSRNSGAAVVGQTIVLTWMGKPWKPPGVQKEEIAPVPEMSAESEAEMESAQEPA